MSEIVDTIRESIRQAAEQCGCRPKEAHLPPNNHKDAVAARNMAIRLASDKGLTRKLLGAAFKRDEKTIRMALKMTEPV